jgi:hypothetical protein
MAPQVGLEPTTLRLTAGCSAIELLRSVCGGTVPLIITSAPDSDHFIPTTSRSRFGKHRMAALQPIPVGEYKFANVRRYRTPRDDRA